MRNLTFEELVQLRQDNKIGWCDFALHSEHADEYLQWCVDHNLHPDDDSAELFLEQTEVRLYDEDIPEEAV